MENKAIDINVDVGEGIGNETEIMPLIASCNIACGGHAGDLDTMQYVVKLAKEYRVKIGAHPSFPDKENFGRVQMDMSCAALFTSVKQQIQTLQDVLYTQHAMLHHIICQSRNIGGGYFRASGSHLTFLVAIATHVATATFKGLSWTRHLHIF